MFPSLPRTSTADRSGMKSSRVALNCAGGASWSLQSVQAALVGAVASLPLIVLRAALWSEPARQTSPALQVRHQWSAWDAACTSPLCKVLMLTG